MKHREHYITAFLGGLTVSLFPTWVVTKLAEKYPSWAPDDLGVVAQFLDTSPWQLQLMFFLVVVIILPVLEEILFRGALWSFVEWLASRIVNPELALQTTFALVTVIFAAAHGNALHALGLLPLSIFLGWLRIKSNEIGPSAVAHMTNNAMAVFLMMV